MKLNELKQMELKRYILMFVNMPTVKVLDKMQELEPETEGKDEE